MGARPKRGWDWQSKETKWRQANKMLSASTLTIVDIQIDVVIYRYNESLPFYYSSTIVITSYCYYFFNYSNYCVIIIVAII